VTSSPAAVETTAVSGGRNTRNRNFYPLTVADVESLCDDAVAVRFAVPDDLLEHFIFQPGQSVTLRRTVDGVEYRRSYSICARVGEPLRVGVREVRGGLFSTWLVRDVRAGDMIEVQSPSGSFHADPQAGGRHLLIAAGSGITPMLSIAGSMLQNPTAEVTLIYANRRSTTVMFTEELGDLKNSYGPRLDVMHVLSREPREAELFSGRLNRRRFDEILDTVVPTDDIDHFWLCGPLGLVEEAEAALTARGIGKDRIHRELFYVEAVPPPVHEHREPGISGPQSQVTVVLDGRSVTGVLPRDTSILEGGQQLRPDLPFACKGGVCGTCRAKLVCGDVDMRRNYALEDSEVADGFILTCQSFPVSANVTVDFDA
jgi:ring-1,2-phenylacetyl-CoA epoxidase subunit PaaE